MGAKCFLIKGNTGFIKLYNRWISSKGKKESIRYEKGYISNSLKDIKNILIEKKYKCSASQILSS